MNLTVNGSRFCNRLPQATIFALREKTYSADKPFCCKEARSAHGRLVCLQHWVGQVYRSCAALTWLYSVPATRSLTWISHCAPARFATAIATCSKRPSDAPALSHIASALLATQL